MDIETLKNMYRWKEIYGCQGRFILKNNNKNLTLEEIAGADAAISRFINERTGDEILIVRIKDGALISYKKPDGTFIHTLNTPEGFIRKLKMLNIDPETVK